MLLQDGTTTGAGDSVTIAPVTSGTQQPDKGNANGGGNQQAPMVQMSQADFDRLIGERVNRAKSTTAEELLKGLGVATSDEAKEMIKKAQGVMAAEMTETQKMQAEIEKMRKEMIQAQEGMAQAESSRQETLLRFAVMQEAMKPDYNLNPQALSDVWTLIDRSEIKLDEAGKAQGVDKALQALAKNKPYLVNNAAAKSPGTPYPQRRTPPAPAVPTKTVSKL